MTLTPSVDDGAIITVNNVAVVSGQPSTPITLSVGNNTVSVKVTSNGGSIIKEHTMNVVRASDNYISTSDNYISTIMVSGIGATLNPSPFSKSVYQYVGSTKAALVRVILTAEDSSVVDIMVNNQPVISGNAITVTMSTTVGVVVEITIQVTAKTGNNIKMYVFNIMKSS